MKTGKTHRPETPNDKAARRIITGAFAILVVFAFAIYEARKHQDAAPPGPPRLVSAVMDAANLIAPDERGRMNRDLETLAAEGGPQIVVATERALKGPTIADDALALARFWRLGRAGRDDGALLLIVERDRKARIEVGYGLEASLTDAASRLIIDQRMEAHLRAGEWTEAARGGVDGMLAVLHPAPIVAPQSRAHELGQLAGMALFGLVIALIALGVVQAIVLAVPGVKPRLERSKRWGWIARWVVLGGGRGGGSSSSSSGGGAGGGGGSFGGGGAND